MSRRSRYALLLMVLWGAWGCGPELVGGGEHGDVHTTMSDEAGGGGAAGQTGPAPALGLASTGGGNARQVGLVGTTTVEIEAELVTAAGGSIELTEGAITRTATIGSSTELSLGEESVEVGVYPAVRLTFRSVTAALSAGSPLPLDIEVSLGTGPLVLDLPVEVVVREDEVTVVKVVLNSAAWVALADPVTGVVEQGEFASAIAVSVSDPVEG